MMISILAALFSVATITAAIHTVRTGADAGLCIILMIFALIFISLAKRPPGRM
ncbi:MAG TPA: hypothetical protein GXZ96_08110 [Firmicutes bacterium]|jgi:cytochrome bd-type quinol oxidase subunit 1|nr:hypothetical protein [Bacillota bacterium]